ALACCTGDSAHHISSSVVACFGAGVAVVGHPLRKACFLLAANREGGPGFCRGAPLSHIDRSGCWRKISEIFGRFGICLAGMLCTGAVGTAFLDQPQRILTV